MADQQNLPYTLPGTLRGKVNALAAIVEIPPAHIRAVSDQEALKALTGLILYRHLSRREEREVNRHWQTLPQVLQMKLRQKRSSILANPMWGIWSLSNEELIEKKEFVSAFNDVAAKAGIPSLSAAGLYKVFKQGQSGNAATVCAFLFVGAMISAKNLEESRIDSEILRRFKRQETE